MALKPQLDYLFGAQFSDGSEYHQNADDTSVTGAGSAFSDLVPRLEEITLFQLEGRGNRYLVDLRDGHFEVNGVPLVAGDPAVDIPIDAKRRLIYFRRVHQTREDDVQVIGHDESGQPIYANLGQRNITHVAYHLGYQCEVDGKNHKVTISVW